MIAPRVVNINKDEYDLYIGRGSKWGNPYPVWECDSRKACLLQYKWYIMHKEELLNSIHELTGKVLGCHCKPQECHGDILVELWKSIYVANDNKIVINNE